MKYKNDEHNNLQLNYLIKIIWIEILSLIIKRLKKFKSKPFTKHMYLINNNNEFVLYVTTIKICNKKL